MLRAAMMISLVCVLWPVSGWAETPEEKGLAIAKQVDDADNGWHDFKAATRMVLRNKQGEESTRESHSENLEVPGDGDKTLIVFDAPADVKGTAFLSFTHPTTPDDQWLYLPALKRVKRIASNNKSGPFVGSEFAYEDIASQEVAKYGYKYVKDESVDGRDSYVVERYPRYENSGYTRQIVWWDKAMLQPLKIEFYDRKDALLKTLTYHDFAQYLGKYWRAKRMEMVNHVTGKSTTLSWLDYQFQQGLTDRDFDQNSLQRAR